MSDRILVTAEQLKEHWMSDDAVGMTDDLQTQTRIVTMLDGTEYEAPFAEVKATQMEIPGGAS